MFPKSVRICCLIEVFGGVFYVVKLLFGFLCDFGAFILGLSQIFSFFSFKLNDQNRMLKIQNQLLWRQRSIMESKDHSTRLSAHPTFLLLEPYLFVEDLVIIITLM